MKVTRMMIVGISGACLLTAAAGAQSPAPVGFGLPGWKEGGRQRIIEIAVLKQDMALSFAEAARYVSTPSEVARVAGAFAEFERIPEPPLQFDEHGDLIPRTNNVRRIDRIYHIVLKQPKGLRLLYLTVDRGERVMPPPTADKPAQDSDTPQKPKPETAPAAAEHSADKPPASAAAAPPAPTVKQPFATVTLWQMRPDTSFLPYCRRTYAPIAANEVPEAVAVLNALYDTAAR